MQTAGYSQTPLAKKLGIKPGFNVRIINAPAYYLDLFTDMPGDVNILPEDLTGKNCIHYFTKDAEAYRNDIKYLKDEIVPDGMIWISWPKKTSKIKTDITEDLIRNIAIENGLVDIKVCAVDEIWSGLKLVIPVKFRKSKP